MLYRFETETDVDEYGIEYTVFVRKEFVEFHAPEIKPNDKSLVLLAIKSNSNSEDIHYLVCKYWEKDYEGTKIDCYIADTQEHRIHEREAPYILGWTYLSDFDSAIKELQKNR